MDFHTVELFFKHLAAWSPRWLTAVAVGAAILLGGLALQGLGL